MMPRRLYKTSFQTFGNDGKWSSVRVNYSKYPQSRYAFLISFGCAPANREKLVAAAQDELEKIRVNGPSASDLQKFIAEDMNSTESAMKTNRY